MYPNCVPDIMILDQTVLQFFFVHKVALIQKMTKSEQGLNSVKYLENFANFNQFIYTLDTNCEPNIMTLAQVVLERYCSQGDIGLKSNNIEKGA